MFQDGSDGVPTDSPPTFGAARVNVPVRGPPRSTRTANSPRESNGDERPRARALGRARQRPRSHQRANGTGGCNTASGDAATFPRALRPPENRSWRSPRGKCARRRAAARRAGPTDPDTSGNGRRRVEFRGRTLWSHPFASKRFHVLLNSLFKVLFNFPSRYLSAIGLVSVFSLRWSLPPTLGCIPKQPDSEDAQRDGARHHRGLTPAPGKAPIRGTRTPETPPQRLS